MGVTLARAQRDALHRTVRDELGEASVVEHLMREGEAERAREAGLYFSALLRLLDDLGWSEQDEREAFELTLRPDDLRRVAQRLIEYADATPADSGGYEQDENLELRAVATDMLEAVDEKGDR